MTETAVTEVNQALFTALEGKLKAAEKEAMSLRAEVSRKDSQIAKLQAEEKRLRATRTDEQLQSEVEGLRRAVGAKDKVVIELQRALVTMKQSEAVALRRATEAERKTVMLENTLSTMQTARNVAQEQVARSEGAQRDQVARAEAAEKKCALAEAALKASEKIAALAGAIVKKSPSLNRNETEVKTFMAATKA